MTTDHNTPTIRALKKQTREAAFVDTLSVEYHAGYVDGWEDAHAMRDAEARVEKVKKVRK